MIYTIDKSLMKEEVNLKTIHKIIIFSYLSILLFLFLFLFIAEGNYVAFNQNTTVNISSKILNIIFSILLLINIIFTCICFIDMIIEIFKNKNFNIKIILLGIYPVLLICILSSFRIAIIINFIISPFKTIFAQFM